jgi:uncharacterized DUF497 family protein
MHACAWNFWSVQLSVSIARRIHAGNLLPKPFIVYTISAMHPISFDPAKDAANQAKHGVSLALAAELEWDTAMCWPDLRQDYGEPRQCGLGYVGLRLYAVGFVDRALPDGTHTRRVISVRKANAREVNRYAEA